MKLDGSTLAGIYDAFLQAGSSVFGETLEEFGADPQDLHTLRHRYKKSKDEQWTNNHLYLPAWLLATGGERMEMTPGDFEALLPTRNVRLAAPLWLLGVVGEHPVAGRLPIRPFVPAQDKDLDLAYIGLFDHTGYEGTLKGLSRPELARGAMVWRIGALIDSLEPRLDDKEGLQQRLYRLHGRADRQWSLSIREKELWHAWVQGFGTRRNSLTHLGDSNFEQCAAYCVEESDRLREAAACMCLAVAARIVQELRMTPLSMGMYHAVLSETVGLDYV